MTEEQIINRYVRGWISLTEFRAEMVRFYDREDAREAVIIKAKWEANAVRRNVEWGKRIGAR